MNAAVTVPAALSVCAPGSVILQSPEALTAPGVKEPTIDGGERLALAESVGDVYALVTLADGALAVTLTETTVVPVEAVIATPVMVAVAEIEGCGEAAPAVICAPER